MDLIPTICLQITNSGLGTNSFWPKGWQEKKNFLNLSGKIELIEF